jgi:hypothetical protein
MNWSEATQGLFTWVFLEDELLERVARASCWSELLVSYAQAPEYVMAI